MWIFCSANDVFIFKAIENLTKAKNIGTRDTDLRTKCLKNAVLLFEEAYESLTLENIENSINIMLDLEFYAGAVGMLLNIAQKLSNSIKVPALTLNQVIDNAVLKKDVAEFETKKKNLYDLIFNILTKMDLKALKITDTNNQLLINEFLELRMLLMILVLLLVPRISNMLFMIGSFNKVLVKDFWISILHSFYRIWKKNQKII